MNIKQFCENQIDALFVRFFFDVQYDFGVTYHYAVYIKYDKNDTDKSIQLFNCMITAWSALQLDCKYIIRGYDPTVFNSKTIINEFSEKEIQKTEVQKPNDYYYIVQQF